MANPLHLKASRTQVLSHIPNRTIGKDGDIVVSNINGKGVYLCVKSGGRWFTASRLSDIQRIDKTAKDIVGKSIKIRDVKNSKTDTDKFIVSDVSGELKYRNSEQIISDLDLDNLSVNYKTSYCSLEGYNNKEECEINGGTWYYSENESHDSISNTAENQLLTLGQSIGDLDSEPTLLYDGSTLEIKRNSDYDDNWQTSAQDTLLKLSYDSSNNTTVGVSSSGDLTITPSGGDTTLSSSTLTIGTIAEVGSDTDKILMSDSGVVKYVTGANLRSYIGAGTSSFGGALNDLSDVTYSSGDLTITSLDKIVSGALEFDCSGDIVIDVEGGCVDFKDDGSKFAELANTANTGNLYLYETDNNSNYFWINTGGNGATIVTTTDSGGVAAHLNFDINGNILFQADGNFTVDKNTSGDSAEDATALYIDYDRTVATSGTAAHNDIGIDLDVNSSSLGTSTVKGMDIDVVGGTGGTHTATGIDLDVDGSDTNIGMIINTAGTHMKLVANADANDYATIAVADTGDLTIATEGDGSTDSDLILDADGDIILDSATGITKFYLAGDTDDLCTLTVEANGQTTIATADSDGTNGNLILQPDGELVFNTKTGRMSFYQSDNLADNVRFDIDSNGALAIATIDGAGSDADFKVDADGDITLDSHTGAFIAMKAGTEFSVANSAYAGMILGYRMIGEDAVHASYTLTTSYTVPDSAMTVRFIAPPSGAVEIFVQVYHNATTSNRTLHVGLSDNATYNSLDGTYECIQNMPDETNDQTIQHYWTVTGLTAGSTYNYWFGAKTSAVNNYLAWGGGSGRYCDFIMKATALPAATSDFAEYD